MPFRRSELCVCGFIPACGVRADGSTSARLLRRRVLTCDERRSPSRSLTKWELLSQRRLTPRLADHPADNVQCTKESDLRPRGKFRQFLPKDHAGCLDHIARLQPRKSVVQFVELSDFRDGRTLAIRVAVGDVGVKSGSSSGRLRRRNLERVVSLTLSARFSSKMPKRSAMASLVLCEASRRLPFSPGCLSQVPPIRNPSGCHSYSCLDSCSRCDSSARD